MLGSAAIAQTDAILTMQDGTQRSVKLHGMLPGGTSVEIGTPDGTGKLGMPVATIKAVNMAAPAELQAAIASFQQKNYDAALAGLKKVNDKYAGLPATWAQQAASTIGLVYIAKGDVPNADASFKAFQRLYPGQGSTLGDVGMGLVAIARKDFDTAKIKLAPVAEQALKTKNVTQDTALAFSQTFLGLGQIKEAEGKYSEALEDYLRTVTLFYHDRTAAALAQERADALRKAHKDVTVP